MTSNCAGGVPCIDEESLNVIFAVSDKLEPSDFDLITACLQLGCTRATVPPIVVGVLDFPCLGGGAAGKRTTRSPGDWCSRKDLRYFIEREVCLTSRRNRQLRPLEPKKVWMMSSFSSVEDEFASREEPMFQDPALNDEWGRVCVTQGCLSGTMGRRCCALCSPA